MRGMTFSEALDWLKKGEFVVRDGWNGKGMYVFYINKWSFTNVKNDNFPNLPFLAMKTADNKIVPWLVSQTDLLADDWWRIDLEG